MRTPRPSTIAVAVALAFAGTGVFAQDTQRVEITGSSIKRVVTEGATPVQTVTRAQIDRLAVTNIGELLLSLPSMAGVEDGGFALAPTLAGFQGAAMPGFGNADTLVLLNGRRLAKYPVGGDAVDLNGIPLSIIERVEILRDGASAVYGSDAIAGVVNLITRREYRGAGLQLALGESSRGDGTKKRASVWGGAGDLQQDRWNVLLGLEADRIGLIRDADRPITASADLRPYGLPDDRLPTSPQPNVQLLASNRFEPIAPCRAPLPPQGVPVASADPGLVCPFDPNANTLLQPAVESRSLYAAGAVLLPAALQLRAEYFYKDKESSNYLNPQPIGNFVDASDPANPYGEDVVWFFRSDDPRLFRRKTIEVKSQRLLLDLSGSAGAFDWQADIGRGVGDYTELSSGYFINSLFTNALRTGVVNPFTGRLSADDLVPLTGAPLRTARTVVDFADAKVSGPLLRLPAGDALFAAGLSWAQEDYRNTPDPLQVAGLLRGDPQLALVNAGRDSTALFGELSLPLARWAEAQLAVRHDRYSDFGNTTNPKLSLRLQPLRELLLRASVGRGFRAPSLENLFATDISGFPQAIDFEGCAAAGTPRDQCTARQIFTASSSNPNLKPEKSEALTLGLVVEPLPGLSASLDYIRVQKNDAIEVLGLQTILDNPDVPVAGFGTARNLVRRLPNGQIDPDTTRPAVIAPTANLAKVDTQMLDLNLRWAFNAAGVRVRLENNSGLLLSRKKSPLPGLALEEFRGLAGFPRWRNVLSANLTAGAFDTTAFVRSISGFKDAETPSALSSDTRTVPSWTTLDINLGWSGLVGALSRIDLTVKNVADRLPPLSAALNTANKIDFNHSAVGRYFQVSVKTEF
jgi:iron complex outermembrane recepter protein